MHELIYLQDFVIILAVGVAVVTVFHRLRLPSIAGFIAAGMLIGPKSLGVIGDTYQVEVMAEVGVALLLFGIGLELPLTRLKRLWRPVLVGGALQVGACIGAAYVGARAFGFSSNTAVFLGFLVAVSSTAIVLRGLQQRGEVDAPHGRLTLGILVFQDLCVVPMMLAVPMLGGGASSAAAIAETFLTAAAILVGVLFAARLVVPFLLQQVARTRQRHLFVSAVLLVCIGTAWVTSAGGVSLALGAFLAGLVVADSEFRHQAMSDLISFRDVFTSVFFVSVGMLLEISQLASHWGLVLVLLGGLLVFKFVVMLLVGWAMRLPLRVAVLSAVALMQVGEFSFILIREAEGTGLLEPGFETGFLAAVTLSMLVTPFALAFGPRVAAGATRVRALTRLLRAPDVEESPDGSEPMRDHVIVAGYGFAGEALTTALKDTGTPYVVVDINIENVRRAREAGRTAFLGDVTTPDTLELLSVHRAREIVLAVNDPAAVERAIKTIRHTEPAIRIVARTHYVQEIPALTAIGATEVVASESSAAGELITRVLGDRHKQ